MTSRCDRHLLSSYRDGELSPEQRWQVEQHLRACPECTGAFRGYLDLAQMIRSMAYQPVPPRMGVELRRRLAEREATGLNAGGLAGLTRAAAPAFAAAALALTVLVVLRPGAGGAPAKAPTVAPQLQVAQPAAPPVAVTTPAIVPVARDDSSGLGARLTNQQRTAGMPASIARLYQGSQALQGQLGAPAEGSKTVTLVEQSFQGGLALWRGDSHEIYVLNRVGSAWAAYPDTWRAGDPVAINATPPPGALAPEGGFGNLWRTRPEVQSRLGWAVYEARDSGGAIQAFEQGLIVWSPHGLLYVLSDDGRWKTYPDASPL
ncbi:MAG TPA: zf-HC2 domain-containing protein [Chloroflexota bacterium]|nr:zf-HC2 domain-containing protein [Chloroflexota bacterium]